MWVRVSYRGREDGWVLTANKRGPILLPAKDGAAAASQAFDAQEAAFAVAAAAATSAAAHAAAPQDDSDRPLTGAKPIPAALDAGGGSDDQPLNVGGGGNGAWVPPSEFPPGHEAGAGAAAPPAKATAGWSASAGDAEFMTSLG